ncbi:MAG: peroxiredoxin [Bacteroidetes bacterium]|nr:MAG: peroxiredoxin [Bacteroidota bacterium]
MSLVNKSAPIFRATAVVDAEKIVQDFSLTQFLGKKEVLFFFYPKDFSLICPTEMLAFQDRIEDFEKRNVALVACSTDSEEVHLAWLNTQNDRGGIWGVEYPLVADFSKTIADSFGILGGNYSHDSKGKLIFEGDCMPLRATFLIDKEGIIRHESVNHFQIARNIDDYLRIIDVWQHSQKSEEICPANWVLGEDTFENSKDGLTDYLSTH